MRSAIKQIILGNTLDPDLRDYLVRVGGLFQAEVAALNTLVTGLKSAGIWSKLGFLWVCPISPTSVGSAQAYLKPHSTSSSCTFSGATLANFNYDGFQSGSIAGLTNIASNALLTPTSMVLGHHSTSNFFINGSDLYAGLGQAVRFATRWSTDIYIFDAGSGGVGGDRLSFSNPDSSGFIVANLNGSTSSIYKNGSLSGSGTIANAGSITSDSFYFAGATRRVSMSFAGNRSNLSAAEIAIFYTFYRAYLQSTGRTVI